MNIIESYVLLAGVGFLQLHSTAVAHILNNIVGNVKEKGMMCTLPVIDMLIQVCIFSIWIKCDYFHCTNHV